MPPPCRLTRSRRSIVRPPVIRKWIGQLGLNNAVGGQDGYRNGHRGAQSGHSGASAPGRHAPATGPMQPTAEHHVPVVWPRTSGVRRTAAVGPRPGTPARDPNPSDDIPDCSPESRLWRQRRATTIKTRLTAQPPLWMPDSDLRFGNLGRGAGQVTIHSPPPDAQSTVDIASGCAGSPRSGPKSHVVLTRNPKGWTLPRLRSCIRGAR